jgi:hypothetical protein
MFTFAIFDRAVTAAWMSSASPFRMNSVSAHKGAVLKAETKIALGVTAGLAITP